MSTDPRATNACVPVSSRKQCYAYPVEGSNLVQLMRVFSFILVTVQVRTERRRSAYRCRNSALEVQYHCLLSSLHRPPTFFADWSAQFRSPTGFTCLSFRGGPCTDRFFLATVSRFALFLSTFYVSIRAAATTTISSASLCATSQSIKPMYFSKIYEKYNSYQQKMKHHGPFFLKSFHG